MSVSRGNLLYSKLGRSWNNENWTSYSFPVKCQLSSMWFSFKYISSTWLPWSEHIKTQVSVSQYVLSKYQAAPWAVTWSLCNSSAGCVCKILPVRGPRQHSHILHPLLPPPGSRPCDAWVSAWTFTTLSLCWLSPRPPGLPRMFLLSFDMQSSSCAFYMLWHFTLHFTLLSQISLRFTFYIMTFYTLWHSWPGLTIGERRKL